MHHTHRMSSVENTHDWTQNLECFLRGKSTTFLQLPVKRMRSEEHTSELQSHRDLHSFPTRRSSDLHRMSSVENTHDWTQNLECFLRGKSTTFLQLPVKRM